MNMARPQFPKIAGRARGRFRPAGKATAAGPAKNNRPVIEGIPRRVRNGARWRDIPEHFGKRNSIHRRFREWSKRGVFDRIHGESRGGPSAR